ncbi:putative parathyroid hormone/parathyroid hormone-related peptide receptor-like isoform X1 [Penaeus vannamei]|uniref:Putative parathyroid hormone/parathyroid hormone-related peptide receptor-like isoform X1 n=1 Tax=Penaeus vannamei TaxID=6689 RepID=A0A3R7PWZ8_PENVA|nr:putative parathyroid hormone/parathyroid hormone-related peptide receptor-like isoform X1 [Penaeus vannamei]
MRLAVSPPAATGDRRTGGAQTGVAERETEAESTRSSYSSITTTQVSVTRGSRRSPSKSLSIHRQRFRSDARAALTKGCPDAQRSLPLGCVGVWAALRATMDDWHCWTVHNKRWIFWLCIRIPVAISNLINFFFFLNVVRVLVLKLKSSISAESMKYRKLGKSTLVLVPLFGVHYFVLWGLSTSTNPYVELAWLFLDQVFASFQGFFVAVLYCLMNGEVRQELRKLYNRWYKGDPLVITSQSTLVSHTKTYAR